MHHRVFTQALEVSVWFPQSQVLLWFFLNGTVSLNSLSLFVNTTHFLWELHCDHQIIPEIVIPILWGIKKIVFTLYHIWSTLYFSIYTFYKIKTALKWEGEKKAITAFLYMSQFGDLTRELECSWCMSSTPAFALLEHLASKMKLESSVYNVKKNCIFKAEFRNMTVLTAWLWRGFIVCLI